MNISVVVPCFNEEESLEELFSLIEEECLKSDLSFEVIFVNDGSSDSSWEVVKALSNKSSKVKGLSFSRNYGKSSALQAGFDTANGEVVITMDADLQDRPEEIPTLYNKIISEDLDLVSGWKKKRHDPLNKTIPSKVFNKVTSLLTGIKLHDFNCGLKAYRKEVIKNIEVYGEMHRYIPVIAYWKGFRKIKEKEVIHHARKHGKTKFGSKRMINGFLDLLSIIFVSKFKKSPMHFFGSFGVLSFLIGFIFSSKLIIEKVYKSFQGFKVEREVTEQPVFFIALTAIIIGVQLFLAGFLAEMITMNSSSIKKDFVVREKAGYNN